MALRALRADPLPEAELGPTTIDSRLNGGNRVDYELQKAAHEETGLNRFAFQAHTCYWYAGQATRWRCWAGHSSLLTCRVQITLCTPLDLVCDAFVFRKQAYVVC